MVPLGRWVSWCGVRVYMYLLPHRGVVPDAKMVAQPTRESAVPDRSYVVGLILRAWTYSPTLLYLLGLPQVDTGP